MIPPAARKSFGLAVGAGTARRRRTAYDDPLPLVWIQRRRVTTGNSPEGGQRDHPFPKRIEVEHARQVGQLTTIPVEETQ